MKILATLCAIACALTLLTTTTARASADPTTATIAVTPQTASPYFTSTVSLRLIGPSGTTSPFGVPGSFGNTTTFDNLIPGTYTITATNPGAIANFRLTASTTITVNPGDCANITLNLTPQYIPPFWIP